MYICRHRFEHLLPPRARRVELLLIRRVFWKIEKSKWGQELKEPERCCPRRSSWAHRELCRYEELGTGGSERIPTPREDLPHRAWEGAISLRVSPGEVLDRGLVIPSSSATRLLCNLGHITRAPGDMAQPPQEPGLGREWTTSDRYGCKNNPGSFGRAVLRHYLTREGSSSSTAIYLCGVQKSALCSAARPPRA